MTWYRGHYGSWSDMTIGFIDGSYDRKEVFDKAMQIANEKQAVSRN